jgi:3-hydroxyacyl-CoA dehydrogenase/enoyl-CoA hydratase/3-hydroxybutyryl-CoA epimerase/enoyl-CoA isomerase
MKINVSGKKNGVGFYQYIKDKKGKLCKVVDDSVLQLLAPFIGNQQEFEEQEVIDRLMVPMCLETIRCLEEGIVATPTEADMALIMGLGFPPFKGGALKYVDDFGIPAFVELCDRLSDIGPMYEVPKYLRSMVEKGNTFYQK